MVGLEVTYLLQHGKIGKEIPVFPRWGYSLASWSLCFSALFVKTNASLLKAAEQGIEIYFGIAPNRNHMFHPIKRVIYTGKPRFFIEV